MNRHWAEDTYWTEALARYQAFREAGGKQLVIDLEAVHETIFKADSPAYRAIDAMISVQEHEGWDGMRGAPRIVLAILQILSEQSRTPGEEL
jgi:hypothetical protein